jgi:hypothetical protein
VKVGTLRDGRDAQWEAVFATQRLLLMTSIREGDDPAFRVLSPEEIDRLEEGLRKEARKLLGGHNRKERNRKLNRANEISRKKSKKAHQGRD